MSQRRASARWLGLSFIAIGALVGLSACGHLSGGASGAAPEATSAASATSATVTTQPSLYDGKTGCPQATQRVSWPSAPDVVLTSTRLPNSATLSVGQTLEVRLPFGHLWEAAPAIGAPSLKLLTPAGYGDASLKDCVWRFTAQSSGFATLAYTMRALCATGQVCPQYVTIIRFTVTVKP